MLRGYIAQRPESEANGVDRRVGRHFLRTRVSDSYCLINRVRKVLCDPRISFLTGGAAWVVALNQRRERLLARSMGYVIKRVLSRSGGLY